MKHLAFFCICGCAAVADASFPSLLPDVEPGGISPAYSGAEWRITAHSQRYDDLRMEKRWFTVEWNGAPGTTGVLETITFPLGFVPFKSGKGMWFMPNTYPPARHGASTLKPGRRFSVSAKFGGPGAVVAESSEGWSCAVVVDESAPYADRTENSVVERKDGITLFSSIKCFGFVHPGKPQTAGDVWIVFREGDGDAALNALPEWFRAVGQSVPRDCETSIMRDTVLYSTHPRGSGEDCAKDRRGFNGAAEYLPFVAALGCNAVWLRPVEDENPYVPRDYYALQKDAGDPEDFWRYSQKAHALGIKVLRDGVVHGGRNNSPRAKAHPDWLAYNRDGSVDPFWCYDFLQPGWLAYIAEFIRHETYRYDLDGWRLDAVSGSREPNWNPSIPYTRASFAQLQGALAQTRSIRAAMRSVKPHAVALAESHMSVLGTTCDAIYEDWGISQRFLDDVVHRSPEDAVASYRRWMHEKRLSSVPGLVFMRYTDNHDHVPCESRYGRAATTAMMAVVAWIDGFPMVLNEHEDGCFEQLREIFRVRRALPELRRGAADFMSVKAPPGVFACLRSLPDVASVVLVNFNPGRTGGDVSAPGYSPFYIDLPAYGYRVVRVKGQPASQAAGARPRPFTMPVECPVTPPASEDGLAFSIETPAGEIPVKAELRNKGNGWLARGGIKVVRRKTPTGWRIGLDGIGRRDPKSLRLVISLPKSDRWFAHTADGSYDSPFLVRHPGYDVVDPNWTLGRRMRHGALRWDSETHPFGFTPGHACVGATVGDNAVVLSGFSGGARVQIWDRVGNEKGLAVTLSGDDVAAFSADIALAPASASAPRVNETGDPRLRPIAGGWRYEDGDLRVHVLRSGALAGVWRRIDGQWTKKLRTGGFFTKTGTGSKNNLGHIDTDCRQCWEYECPVRLGRGEDGTLTLSFESGELRARDLHASRMRKPILYRTTYTFGAKDGFGLDTSFSAPRDYGADEGEIGFRFEFPGTFAKVEGDDCWRRVAEMGLAELSDRTFWGAPVRHVRLVPGGQMLLLWHERGDDPFHGVPGEWHGFSAFLRF
jgi:hypothetical protein